MNEIAGKNIIITGAAHGMGRLLAMQMARLGGRVVVYDVAAEALEAVVDGIGAAGGGGARLRLRRLRSSGGPCQLGGVCQGQILSR